MYFAFPVNNQTTPSLSTFNDQHNQLQHSIIQRSNNNFVCQTSTDNSNNNNANNNNIKSHQRKQSDTSNTAPDAQLSTRIDDIGR